MEHERLEVEDVPEIVRCPWCGANQRSAGCRRMRRPPGREHQFAPMLCCAECGQWFAPRDPDAVAASLT